MRTDRTPVSLNSFGVGILPVGGASAVLRGRFDGELTGFQEATRGPFTVRADWDAGTFGMSDGFIVPARNGVPELKVRTVLRGKIVNQPPRIAVVPPQIAECGQSAEVTAVAEDPDGNLAWVQWYSGSDIDPESRTDGNTAQVDTTSIGSRTLSVVAGDQTFSTAVDKVEIEVRDSSPPELRTDWDEPPPCIWAPNHHYAVLRLDREIAAEVIDQCDERPHVEIIAASSSQASNAIGDGNTSPDIVVFPDRVCVRSERSGADQQGRTYTVQLEASDASGNSALKSLEILVPHDQSEHCRDLRIQEYAEQDSKTCDPAEAAAAWLRAAQGGSTGSTRSRTSAAGCSAITPASNSSQAFGWLLLLGLAITWRRRSS